MTTILVRNIKKYQFASRSTNLPALSLIRGSHLISSRSLIVTDNKQQTTDLDRGWNWLWKPELPFHEVLLLLLISNDETTNSRLENNDGGERWQHNTNSNDSSLGAKIWNSKLTSISRNWKGNIEGSSEERKNSVQSSFQIHPSSSPSKITTNKAKAQCCLCNDNDCELISQSINSIILTEGFAFR